jgi:hypothetical protein
VAPEHPPALHIPITSTPGDDTSLIDEEGPRPARKSFLSPVASLLRFRRRPEGPDIERAHSDSSGNRVEVNVSFGMADLSRCPQWYEYILLATAVLLSLVFLITPGWQLHSYMQDPPAEDHVPEPEEPNPQDPDIDDVTDDHFFPRRWPVQTCCGRW